MESPKPESGALSCMSSYRSLHFLHLRRFYTHPLTGLKKCRLRASLVAPWLRIRLPMQGTRVRALAREDPTCCGATKPVRHSYRACALEPTSHNY